MKHTAGPWAVCYDKINVYAPETDTAITNSEHPCYPDQDEAIANARLIAAAPELLAALKNLVSQVEKMDRLYYRDRQLLIEARQAIAAATGE